MMRRCPRWKIFSVDSKSTTPNNCSRSLRKMRISWMPLEPWNREEIGKHFETLFILYAKKNAAYVIEETIRDTNGAVGAIVLWKNAVLASLERIWMHRMSVVLVPEGEEWTIVLIQV